ncbi:MAG: tetratricopeptide repeat protein, partial [Crocinitomicaceae bacterium]|nr:tetratricopeptide repeat protein [Crocinitomicaceae bacterium]
MEIDYAGVEDLLSFKMDENNMFAATSEIYVEEYPGEYLELVEIVKELLEHTYNDQGMDNEISETRTEVIDGIEFSTYTIEVYRKDGVILINQIIYSALINGYDFNVTMTYTEEEDKVEMLEMWRNSTFDKSEFDSDYDLEYDEEIEAQYEKIINKADSLYDLGRYDKASELYERATSIKPEEEYPFDMLEEIESLKKSKKEPQKMQFLSLC